MLYINENIQIRRGELEFTFARSSGKGGQNVNKVNSKAILNWSPALSSGLPRDVKERFLAKYSGRLSQEGVLQIQSDRFRDQGQNVRDCLEKLRQLILPVIKAPKSRKATKPTRAARLRRLEGKRRQSEKKRSRRGAFE